MHINGMHSLFLVHPILSNFIESMSSCDDVGINISYFNSVGVIIHDVSHPKVTDSLLLGRPLFQSNNTMLSSKYTSGNMLF